MNGTSIISRLVGRLPIDKPFSSPYRGVLITPAYKPEVQLFALLGGGLGLIILMTCLHMQALFSDVDLHSFQPPPHRAIDIVAEQVKPEIALANNHDSLFQLLKQDTPVNPLLTDAVERDARPKAAMRNTRLWQLQIHRPAISETLVINEIENAARQLQSGQVSVAQQTLRAVLARDSHSVEAMEVMRLASRQLGDVESEQQYLERLRLEIPEYDFDRNDALISGSD